MMKRRISQTLFTRVSPIPCHTCQHGIRSLSSAPSRKVIGSTSGSQKNSVKIPSGRPDQPLKSLTRRCLSSTSSSGSALPQVLVNDMANQELIVDFHTGTALRYPSFWLRDNCACTECQHPSTHQRQVDTFAIDPEIKVAGVEARPEGLQVTWPATTGDGDTGAVKGTPHQSVYPWDWLQTHPPFTQSANTKKTSTSSKPQQRQWAHVPPSAPSLPSVPFDSITSATSNSGLRAFLQTIHTLGLCLIPSTPADPSATQQLVERIAHIRPTHYGGFWDFTSQPAPIDTAYTDDYLPPHTDTTYFTDPAGLQLFHCLQPATQGGGESTFVDGFAAAKALSERFPQHYHTLSTYPVVSAALGSSSSSDGDGDGDPGVGSFFNTATSARGYPVFVHGTPTHPSPAHLVQIRWNNLDRVTPSMPSFPSHTAMKAWYAAAREWARLLESPEFLLTVQLQPGEPVIFDNWRYLHGRLAFKGQRRVCGAYVGMDDFRARCRALGVEA